MCAYTRTYTRMCADEAKFENILSFFHRNALQLCVPLFLGERIEFLDERMPPFGERMPPFGERIKFDFARFRHENEPFPPFNSFSFAVPSGARGSGAEGGTPEKGTKQARQSSLNLLPISCTAAALGALPGPSFCRLPEHEQKWKIFYKCYFASRYICNSGKAWGGWLSGVPYASAEP